LVVKLGTSNTQRKKTPFSIFQFGLAWLCSVWCATALLLRHSCATEIVVVAVGCATTYYVGGAGGGGANCLAPVMRH